MRLDTQTREVEDLKLRLLLIQSNLQCGACHLHANKEALYQLDKEHVQEHTRV
jgi:hypothetical protein